MKALLLLALTLINASPKEQDLMLADLYAADPRLAVEVLDVANELGADTDELAIVIAIIADSKGGIALIPETDPVSSGLLGGAGSGSSTKAPVIGAMYDPEDDSKHIPGEMYTPGVEYHKGF